jgi:hypothetical protein
LRALTDMFGVQTEWVMNYEWWVMSER